MGSGIALAALCAGLFAATAVAGALPLVAAPARPGPGLARATAAAAGALLGSALLVALPEGFALAADRGASPFAGLAVLAGFLFMLAVEHFGLGHAVHEDAAHRGADPGSAGDARAREACAHEALRERRGTVAMAAGLSLHAAADGLALGAAVATGSVELTGGMLWGVLAHKLPAAFGLGVFAARLDRAAGSRAIVAFAAATPLALAAAAALFRTLPPAGIPYALLFAGGTFLYVATVDALPALPLRGVPLGGILEIAAGAAASAALLALGHAAGLA